MAAASSSSSRRCLVASAALAASLPADRPFGVPPERLDAVVALVEGAGAGEGEGGAAGEEADEDMREAFRVFDANGDGYITVDELGAVLSSLGLKQGRTAEECRRMIGRVDRDGDGRVDFHEFRQMMLAGGLATLG